MRFHVSLREVRACKHASGYRSGSEATENGFLALVLIC